MTRRLAPGGLFAFSCERLDGGEAVVVRESLRFAHQPEATRAALGAAGLQVLAWEEGMLRRDRGQLLTGFLVLAGRPYVPAAAVTPAAVEAAEDALTLN